MKSGISFLRFYALVQDIAERCYCIASNCKRLKITFKILNESHFLAYWHLNIMKDKILMNFVAFLNVSLSVLTVRDSEAPFIDHI